MRNANINAKTFFYLNYKGTEEVTDSDEDYSGEKIIKYDVAKSIRASVSGARGTSLIEVFGTDIEYDKTICMTKSDFVRCKIDENTVFFIDKKVEYQNGRPLYNYRVKRIAETINQVVIAIKKVSDNGN